MANEEEKEIAKKKVLAQMKEEVTQEAEIASANYAGATPEEILAADKSDRQQQYLASMGPDAISAAELELR